MDSSVSPKDEILFLRVCHHISNAVYLAKIHKYVNAVIGNMTEVTHPVPAMPLWYAEGKIYLHLGRNTKNHY